MRLVQMPQSSISADTMQPLRLARPLRLLNFCQLWMLKKIGGTILLTQPAMGPRSDPP
jgi:hypothetical protein